MRLPIALTAALCIAGTSIAPAQAAPRSVDEEASAQVTNLSAAKRKKAVRSRRPSGPAVGPIACTRSGCQHIPAGCHIEPERSLDGTPTGFDMAVCPYR